MNNHTFFETGTSVNCFWSKVTRALSSTTGKGEGGGWGKVFVIWTTRLELEEGRSMKEMTNFSAKNSLRRSNHKKSNTIQFSLSFGHKGLVKSTNPG